MGTYRIYHSSRFDKELLKFDRSFLERVDKIEEQLTENPYVGDPLSVRWFREKKIGKNRIYYIIYEDLKAVFMVGISEKKDQQKAINTIRLLLEFFKEELMSLIDKEEK